MLLKSLVLKLLMISYHKTFTLTRELVDKWISITGDDNPIHKEDSTLKYGKPVVPGFLVTSFITHQPMTPNWAVAKINVKYHDAVFIDDTINAKYEVIKERPGKLRVTYIEIYVGTVLKQSAEITTVALD